jgi:[acyl-carrier-protein] S-malonyltransferase
MKIENIAFVFPGQGSQEIGMGGELAEAFPVARQVFQQADELLGLPLTRLAWEGPEAELNDTINTQPALLTHSVAALYVLREQRPDLQPAFVAGHSMGELSALVACEALPFADALRLARRRGELMKQAGEISPGGMAAVLGMDIPALESVCAEASLDGEVVQVANDNCPGQVVISGAKAALERAIQLAQQRGARRVRPLAVSIAAHSPLMSSVVGEYRAAVNATPVRMPAVPVIGNISAHPMLTVDEIRDELAAQLTWPVRWTASVQHMVGQGISRFIEVGPKDVLSKLAQRIDPGVEAYSVGDLTSVRDLA